MKLTRITLLSLVCAAAPLAARAGVEVGINVGVPEVVVRTQPPPLRSEMVPVAPGPGFIWIRGHWGWHRDRWEWIGGRWDRVAQPGAEWVPGRWAVRGGGWVWIEGHYAAVAVAPAPSYRPQAEIVAAEEPPVPIAEAVPVAPGPDYFWIGGHWHWNGGWVWMNGHFDRHPHYHPGAYWEAGRWDHRGERWVWREGRWH